MLMRLFRLPTMVQLRGMTNPRFQQNHIPVKPELRSKIQICIAYARCRNVRFLPGGAKLYQNCLYQQSAARTLLHPSLCGRETHHTD
jgi:hypothetical protein